MRFVQSTELAHAVEQLIGHAMHDLPDLAEDVAMQTTEIGDASGRSHAAEKAVPLDQQHRLPAVGRRHRRRNAGRAAAQYHHIELAEDRRLPARLGQQTNAGSALGGH